MKKERGEIEKEQKMRSEWTRGKRGEGGVPAPRGGWRVLLEKWPLDGCLSSFSTCFGSGHPV